MSGLELELRQYGSIELPVWIAESSLSLSEIGAVAVLACLQEVGESEGIRGRMETEDFMDSMKSLIEQGLVKFKVEGAADKGATAMVRMDIDLELVNPDQQG